MGAVADETDVDGPEPEGVAAGEEPAGAAPCVGVGDETFVAGIEREGAPGVEGKEAGAIEDGAGLSEVGVTFTTGCGVRVAISTGGLARINATRIAAAIKATAPGTPMSIAHLMIFCCFSAAGRHIACSYLLNENSKPNLIA